jgi:hypothetical protein
MLKNKFSHLLSQYRVKLRFRTCVFLVRYGTIRYDTLREKNRHTNKLEGLFPYVRLRDDGVRYDTPHFFSRKGVRFFWEIYGAAKGRDVKFSLMTILFCERKQEKVSQ